MTAIAQGKVFQIRSICLIGMNIRINIIISSLRASRRAFGSLVPVLLVASIDALLAAFCLAIGVYCVVLGAPI